MLMEEFIIYVALALFGACAGSFAGATVWRLRIRQLQYDKEHKEPYDRSEYKRLKKLQNKTLMSDRSQCLECGYELRWYDLLPIISWLTLKGKCRACKRSFGKTELFVEIIMTVFFVGSYALWPGGIGDALDVTHFVLWLLAGTAMAILFIYDLKWFLLPDEAVIALAVIGLGIVGVSAADSRDIGGTLAATVGAVAVLGGLYAVLYGISKGKWVGFGDVKLGAALALILVDWQLAAAALFLANFIGCLIVIPALAFKKLERTSRVPFGPLLIAGSVTAWFVGWPLLDAYLAIIGV